MSGRDNPPDDSPDDLAYDWVTCEDRNRADQLFEALVRAVESELLTSARTMAYKIIGDSNDVDDAINAVWVKILERQRSASGADSAAPGAMAEQTQDEGSPERRPGGFDPSRASFNRYFFVVLRSACYDIRRRRHSAPLPVADVAIYGMGAQGEPAAEAEDFEEEILEKIESIKDRITAAIEVLDISEQHRDMLRLFLEPEETAPPADHKTAAARQRKQKERLRDQVAALADLTPEELEAVSLVRKHHSVAMAVAVAPGVEVRRLFASAKGKVAALFDIETEGLT